MERFEYEITTHTSENFKKTAYTCTEVGECKLPDDQTALLLNVLNDRGREGWELVQFTFNKTGITAFWKRKYKE